MDDFVRAVAIDTLTKSKLGTFYGWTAPEPVHDVGPSDIERFEQFELNVRLVEQEVRAGLETRDDDDLGSLVSKSGDGSTVEWFESFLSGEITGLANKQPIWLALGFGHPDHAADFNYWSKVGLLSVQEATLLSVGLEPDKEHLGFLERVRDAAGQPNKNDQAIFLSKRYRLIRDHFPFGVSSLMAVSPAWFLWLIQKIDLEVPQNLKAALSYLSDDGSDAEMVERPEAMTASVSVVRFFGTTGSLI